MYNLTRPCRCKGPHGQCKDLKLKGDNEFWIKAKPDGTHCTWAYCNACFSRFHLDGTNELVGGNVWVMTEYDEDDPCNYCVGDPDAMAQVQTWREANA
jgi:hypothetical protein